MSIKCLISASLRAAAPAARLEPVHSRNLSSHAHKKLSARTRVRIFPNREAVIRLVEALMLEQNDEWAVCRRYMPMEKLADMCNDPDEAVTIAAQ